MDLQAFMNRTRSRIGAPAVMLAGEDIHNDPLAPLLEAQRFLDPTHISRLVSEAAPVTAKLWTVLTHSNFECWERVRTRVEDGYPRTLNWRASTHDGGRIACSPVALGKTGHSRTQHSAQVSLSLKAQGRATVWSDEMVAATLGRLAGIGGPSLLKGTAATPGTWNWTAGPPGGRSKPHGIQMMVANEQEALAVINLLNGRAITLGSDILALVVTRSGNGSRRRA